VSQHEAKNLALCLPLRAQRSNLLLCLRDCFVAAAPCNDTRGGFARSKRMAVSVILSFVLERREGPKRRISLDLVCDLPGFLTPTTLGISPSRRGFPTRSDKGRPAGRSGQRTCASLALSLSQGEAKYQTGEPHLARQMTLATFFAGQSETTPNTARLACAVLGGARSDGHRRKLAGGEGRMGPEGPLLYGRSESALAAWRARVLCRSALKDHYSLPCCLRWWAKGDGEETRRVVSPLQVTAYAGYLYLIAFCHLRNEQRTFRLDRMIEMRSDS